jgi:hypothetical protein
VSGNLKVQISDQYLRWSYKSDSREGLELVAGEGFEPSKAEPADLQSAPIGRSGNPPRIVKRGEV